MGSGRDTELLHANRSLPLRRERAIACEERLILPVDVMFADNDGGVSGLCQLAEAVCAHAQEGAPEEVFAREQLATGSDIPHLLSNGSGPCAVRGLVAGALTARVMRENRNGAFLRGRS